MCIGTVVTKDNYKILPKIGNLLKQYPVNIWILYQFTPSGGNAKKNRKLLEIPLEKYVNSTKLLNNQFSDSFKVIVSPTTERSKAYFLIKPDGTVFTPVKENNKFNEVILGSIFDPNTIRTWEEIQKNGNYTKKTKHFSQEKILKGEI